MSDGEVEDAMAAMGVKFDDATLQKLEEGKENKEEGDLFEIWEENAKIVEIFLRCSTQWRFAGGMSSMIVGLDYPAVDVIIRRSGVEIKDYDDVFEGVQIMERAALKILNSKVHG